MVKKRENIEEALIELDLPYNVNAQFVKVRKGSGFYNFDLYISKPHKIIINLSSLTNEDIDFLSSCDFNILNFSADLKYDYYSLISSLIKNTKTVKKDWSKKKNSFTAKKKTQPNHKKNLEKIDSEFIKIIPGKISDYNSPF